MIVAATRPTPSTAEPSSFFDAILARYHATAHEYRLVTQPDHAKLSGALAAALDRERLPYITGEVIAGIAAHDSGWLALDGAAPRPILPPYEPDGRLRSFLNTPPDLFLNAWTASIQHSEQIGPTAGTMVSQHFERLAQFRLERQEDSAEDVARLRSFLVQESSRRERLRKGTDSKYSEERLILLQVCDVVSLYWCCGLDCAITIPQQLGAGHIRVLRRDDTTELHGVPLRTAFEADCPAYLWRTGSPTLLPDTISVRVRPTL